MVWMLDAIAWSALGYQINRYFTPLSHKADSRLADTHTTGARIYN